jgi:hypothetical protein
LSIKGQDLPEMKSCTLLLLKKNTATGEMLYGVVKCLRHDYRPKEWASSKHGADRQLADRYLE